MFPIGNKKQSRASKPNNFGSFPVVSSVKQDLNNDYKEEIRIIKNLTKSINTLTNEKKSLGIFSSRRKNDIENELRELNSNLRHHKWQLKKIIPNITSTVHKAISQIILDDVGTHVRIGTRTINGAQYPIDWVVLSISNDAAFLVSTNSLYKSKFHDKPKTLDCGTVNHNICNYCFQKVYWETSFMRKWLNTSFINSVFDKNEAAQIIQVTNINHNGEGDNFYGSGLYGGNNTIDRIFLLSEVEFKLYGADGLIQKSQSPYWLRTPAYDFGCYAAIAWEYPGYVLSGAANKEEAGVRPAFYFNLNIS